MIRQFGKLFITSHHICFFAKLFGTAQKKKINITDITALQQNNNEITVTTKKVSHN